MKRKRWAKAKAKLPVALYGKSEDKEMGRMKWRQVFDDGREVLNRKTVVGRLTYKARTVRMEERQCGICPECAQVLVRPTFDHENGRGMNGAKRDDRIELPNGEWINAAVCWDCNTKKGSRAGYKFPLIAKGMIHDERLGAPYRSRP
jgi:hypothetical protein